MDDEIPPTPSGQTGEVVPPTAEVADEDTFKILLATDIHLGFCENDLKREDDSFNTFEEILQIAVKNDVDFVLLGGDLFHENKPRPNVLQRATEILSKYSLGSRPVAFEYVGNPETDFPTQEDHEINYYCPNVNIGLPVFTIHGNHDDPIGTTKTSAVDHLAAAKLLNHFGQWDNLNRITVSPVLLVKGKTKLAMYGLGHLKDERLHRLMHDRKVTFVGPKEDSKSWFNLFVLHQNRVKHSAKDYIPENFIPGFMDLVLWGHEHECRIRPEEAQGLDKTRITQPGSSVATSLCLGESKDKFVGLLKINRRLFRLEPIKLETVRPLVFKDVMIKDILKDKTLPKGATAKQRSTYLEKYVTNLVDSLIEEADDKLTGHPKQPLMPLIRIRLFHEDMEDTFNPIRFSQKFTEKVANDDIVLFKKVAPKHDGLAAEIDAEEIEDLVMQQDDDDLESHVENIVESYFKNAEERGDKQAVLEVLSERGLSHAVKCAVEKNDIPAISLALESQIEKVIAYLISKNVTEETVEESLKEFRERRAAQVDQEINDMLNKRAHNEDADKKKKKQSNGSVSDDGGDAEVVEDDDESPVEIDDYDDDEPTTSRSTRGRGSSRARGSSTGRGRGGRGRAKNDDYSFASPLPTRGRGRSAAGTSRGRNSKEKTATGKGLVQTTLNIRRSPRKGSQAMTFDDDSD